MPCKRVNVCMLVCVRMYSVYIANKVLLPVNLDCQGNASGSIKCVSLIITNNCFSEQI